MIKENEAQNLSVLAQSGEPASGLSHAQPDSHLLSPNTATKRSDSTRAANKLNKEDLLLYTFCLFLLVFVGSFFWKTQNQLEATLTAELDRDVSAQINPSNSNDYYHAYLQTQMMISSKRYRQGARILLTTSTRKNTGFLVGTLLAFMGCIIVIRRIRKMPVTADFAATERAKLKVITSSPGVFITLLGAIIILSTILRYDSFDIDDATIAPPRGMVETPAPSPTASPTNSPALSPEEQKKLHDLLKTDG